MTALFYNSLYLEILYESLIAFFAKINLLVTELAPLHGSRLQELLFKCTDSGCNGYLVFITG